MQQNFLILWNAHFSALLEPRLRSIQTFYHVENNNPWFSIALASMFTVRRVQLLFCKTLFQQEYETCCLATKKKEERKKNHIN